MMRIEMKRMRFLFVMLMFGLFLSFSGCLENLSLNSFASEDENVEFVESDIGKIKILKVDPTLMQFIKDNISDSLLKIEKMLSSDLAEQIQLGNDFLGFCKLNFPTGTLNNDVRISMQWDIKKGIFEVEFGPDRLNFNKPVSFEMFYKIATLNGIDEDKLKFFYYNEEKEIWEVIGGVADISKKIFTVQITHFSRYALAHSE